MLVSRWKCTAQERQKPRTGVIPGSAIHVDKYAVTPLLSEKGRIAALNVLSWSEVDQGLVLQIDAFKDLHLLKDRHVSCNPGTASDNDSL